MQPEVLRWWQKMTQHTFEYEIFQPSSSATRLFSAPSKLWMVPFLECKQIIAVSDQIFRATNSEEYSTSSYNTVRLTVRQNQSSRTRGRLSFPTLPTMHWLPLKAIQQTSRGFLWSHKKLFFFFHKHFSHMQPNLKTSSWTLMSKTSEVSLQAFQA